MLGRLQFGTVGGLEDETDAIGQAQVLGPMPARLIELQHDALSGSGTDRLGKIGKNEFEHLLANSVGDVAHRLAGCRVDEPGHIEPFEAMMAKHDRPLADRRPHPARDRLQAKAMFVHRPDFDARTRILLPFLASSRLQVFLSAARSSSVAASGWRGRGCCTE